MKKLRITPLNLLSILFGTIFVYLLIVTKDTGQPRHLDFRGVTFVLFAIPLLIHLILRVIFKDFAKIVIAETVFLTLFLLIVTLFYTFR